MTLYKGKITGFRGSWLSGLASLVLEDEYGGVMMVHCENAQTVRCLDGAFGDVIEEPDHTVKPDGGHIGKWIYYSMDPMGLVLEGFTPVDDAPPELVELYEKQGEQNND